MGDPSSCAEAPDDLEITSIGTLYRGPWDKKYWSCSRGKDRYPYPVGYLAVRTHAGSTYRMEIHEGPKGPLFVVTSTDADSCTGQTPDIAWDHFQKKSGPKVKNWHGRRFSCKVDGVEIFGFRNPFVQRLLRELVANVNGMAERSLASSSFSNGALQLDSEIRMQDSHVYPDLLPYLWKQHSGKRSTKSRSSPTSFSKEGRAKRICHDFLKNVEGGASEQIGELCLHTKDSSTVHIQEKKLFISKDGSLASQIASHHLKHSLKSSVAALSNETLCKADHERQNDDKSIGAATSINKIFRNEDIRTSSLHLSISTLVEEDNARDGLLMGSEHSDCIVEKHVISHEKSKVTGRGNHLLTYAEDRVFHADKRLLDRLSDAELDKGNSLVAPKDSVGEISASEWYSDVCVSYTCDTLKDDTAGFTLESNKGRLCSMKSETVTAEPVLGTSASCALEVIPGSVPNEFISKNENCFSESMHSMAPETCTPVDGLSKGYIKDSLQEVGSSSGSSNLSLEKIDLDLAGQELARSMMTFLLPRAVPLLKNTYVKRRSRYQNRETKRDPCSDLSGANSAECNLKNDRLTDFIYQGKLVTETLALELGEKIPEKVIVPDKIFGVDSLGEVTKVEPPVSSCMANEPFDEGGISKDAKSIVPDSFEDIHCLCDVTTKRPLTSGSDEVDAALSGEIKHNNDTSKSLVNDAGGGKGSSTCLLGNDECKEEVMLTKELDKVGNFLSDSLVACVHPDKCKPLEESFNDEHINVDEKISCPDHDDTPPLRPSCDMDDCSLQFNGDDCICNAEEEMLHFEGVPLYASLRNHKGEHFEQDLPAPCSNYENLGGSDVLKSIFTQYYSINGSPDKKLRSSSPHELVNFDVPAIDFGDANLKCQVSALRIPQVGLEGKAVLNGEGNSSFFCRPNSVLLPGGPSSDSFKEGIILHSPLSYGKCNIPLSESIIFRNLNVDNVPNAYIVPVSSPTAENGQATNKGNDAIIKIPVSNEVKVDKKHLLDVVENVSVPEFAMFSVAADVTENQGWVSNVTEDRKASNFLDSSVSCFKKNIMDAPSVPVEWRKDISDPSRNQALKAFSCSDENLIMKSTTDNYYKNLSDTQPHQKNCLTGFSIEEANSNKELGGHLELVGCYLHPYPVLFIWLSSKEGGLRICVLCGLYEGRDRNIFVYKVPNNELRENCPSFLGYTSLVLPLLSGSCDGNVPFERSGIQFTPDGQSLVFLNSIKAPHCRSDCAKENAVKVACIKFGYLSPMAKLTTNERISCILVCEPNYLIAAEASGRLHVWIMNCTWSATLEEFMLPNFDYVPPAVLELKRIPKSDSLIIGHNGICGFGLWDISKRSLLARFSSPGHTIFQILPIRLFSQGHDKETVLTANNWLSQFGENTFPSSTGENIAVWLLVSAALDSKPKHDQVKQTNTNPVGCWRLALLAKNMVIVGSMLDTRACAVDASADYAVIGTCDGLLYKLELSTGKKLGNLHPFTCGGISRIAIDAKTGALAVASDERKLMVYVQN